MLLHQPLLNANAVCQAQAADVKAMRFKTKDRMLKYFSFGQLKVTVFNCLELSKFKTLLQEGMINRQLSLQGRRRTTYSEKQYDFLIVKISY